MLKRLRKKFILITMSLITVILLAVFVVSTVSTYQASFDSMHASLEQALTPGGKKMSLAIESRLLNDIIANLNEEAPLDSLDPALKDNPNYDPSSDKNGKGSPPKIGENVGAYVLTYSVTVNSHNEIISDSNPYAEMSKDLVSTAVFEAASRESSEGFLTDLNLYYMKSEYPEGTRMAFADSANVTDPLWGSIRTSLLVGVGAWLLFFLASIFLARTALKPVEEAWGKQKQFVADASHELKTPLTIILANNEILLSAPEKTIRDQKKWVINSQEEAERMERLINNLLMLAQIEQSEEEGSAQKTLGSSPVNISEMLEKSLLQFEAIAFERKIETISHVEEGIMVKGDADQLERLIKILVDNACKYAEVGGTINIDLSKSENKIKFKVSNTGSFISENETEQIFERFYRSDESRARSDGNETGGYGLGLSIAQGIVQAHKGTIVASSVNNTTTFEVTLPA